MTFAFSSTDGSVTAGNGVVCTVDGLASAAGLAILRAGGTAVDAAIAANAVLAVTAPHMCGLGGDLFALVTRPDKTPVALNASGRAPRNADPAALRGRGLTRMPLSNDLASVTVPGCVDGWLALHDEFGELPLTELFASAIGYAETGFTASPLLVSAVRGVAANPGAADLRAALAGEPVRRPGVARTLRAVAAHGRDGFYAGEFGTGLIRLSKGLFTVDDLGRNNADWVSPVSRRVFGHDVWTTPANTQGYLLPLALGMAEHVGLPSDPDDPDWLHTLAEATRLAGQDRPDVLHEHADVGSLLSDAEVARRASAFRPDGPTGADTSGADGDTTYLCVLDGGGTGVSLIQSNASGFGSGIFEPDTGIGLHNRGLGFNLRAGHPAEYGPGRRPPHTLMPVAVTEPDGRTRLLAGTMGGDTQPQIMTQLLARILRHGESVSEAVTAPRWRVGNTTGFDTWTQDGVSAIELEDGTPASWRRVTEYGQRLRPADGAIGHAHAIEIARDGTATGAADPRAVIGSAVGY